MFIPRSKITKPNGEDYIFSRQEFKIVTLEYNRTEKHYGKYDPLGLDEVIFKTNNSQKKYTTDEILLKLKKVKILKKFFTDKIQKIENDFMTEKESYLKNFEIDRLYYYYRTVLKRIEKLIIKYLNNNLLV